MQPTFNYNLNLQYQDGAACILEFTMVVFGDLDFSVVNYIRKSLVLSLISHRQTHTKLRQKATYKVAYTDRIIHFLRQTINHTHSKTNPNISRTDILAQRKILATTKRYTKCLYI